MGADGAYDAGAIRRRMLLGSGAAAVVAAGLRGETAQANPRTPPGQSARTTMGEGARSTPSGIQSGYTYRSLSWVDFSPEDADVTRHYGGYGAYGVGGAGPLWATMDLPAGAVVKEIEWYASNASGSTVVLRARRWHPGEANHASPLADDTLSTAAAGIRTRKTLVPATTQNVFEPGTKLALGFESLNSLTQVAGARIGFTGGGALTMRGLPTRVYDSRDHTILAGGVTRLVTLPPYACPEGTTAVVVNLTAVGASAGGYLRLYAANSSVPTVSSINFSSSGAAIANGLVVGVSSVRQLNVYASATTHFIIDVLGTVS